MRKLYLISLTVLFVSGAFAQTSILRSGKMPINTKKSQKVNTIFNTKSTQATYFSDSFNNLNNWTANDHDGDGENWYVGDFSSYITCDASQAVSRSWTSSAGALTPDNLLTTTAAVDLTGGTSTLTMFYEVGSIESTSNWWEEYYSVYITTSNDVNTIIASTPVFSETLPSGGAMLSRNIDLSSYAGQQVYITFRHYNCTDDNTLLLDNLIIKDVPANDAELTSLNVTTYVAVPANVDIKGTITNQGSTAITALDVKWTDGTNTYTDNLTGLNITPIGGTYNFTSSTQLNVATANQNDITVWVELASDADLNNDTLSTSVIGLSQVPTKRVMGEEATGTWCGWCPRGLVGLLYMETNYPSTWVGVAVHNSDPMTVTAYDAAIGNYISGYPSSLVDRQNDEVDPSDWEAAYTSRVAEVSPVDVDITNINWNGTTMQVTFDVDATFYSNITNGSYNINAVIVEDGLTGTTSSWDQHNYYSSQSNNIDLIDVNGLNWKTLSDPVPAADMVYDHVAREILGGWAGNSGDIPTSITDGTTYSHSYSYTVTGNQYKTKLVGFVIDNATGEILNVIEKNIIPVNVPKTENEVKVKLYPNPSSGQFYMISNTPSTVEVYNALGEIVYSNKELSKLTEINISNLTNGTYVVKVYSDKQVTTKRIVLNK